MSELDERLSFTTTKNKNFGLIFSFILDKNDQSCSSTIIVPRFYQGWDGVVHGGITSTMLDEAMAYACSAAGFPDVVTASLEVKYIRPVPIEKELHLWAKVYGINGRVFDTKAKLFFAEQLLAQSAGKMFKIDNEWKEKQSI